MGCRRLFHTTPYVSNCTPPGMSCGAVENGIDLDLVLMDGEDKDDKCGGFTRDGDGVGGWSCLVDNE